MSNAPFPIQPELTAVAIAVMNKEFIADKVMPEVRVGKQEFKYLTHTTSEHFTIPDTKVGRKSAPNQVEFTATETDSSTKDYGLDDPVPQADIDNAPANYNPLASSVEKLTNLILLDREQRTAGVVFNASNHNSSVTLSGTSQWTDTTNSTPISDIQTGLDTPIIRPNIMVIGQAAWSALRKHPSIVKATNRNSGDAGLAARQAVAELFELDEVIVGRAFYNSAKKGQTASYSRLWGKHCALLHRAPNPNTENGGWGFTARWGTRIAGATPDKNIGLRGGQLVRVGESLREVVSSTLSSYYLASVAA
jgi:hypothetical protein